MNNQESIWNKLYKERLNWKKETITLPNILKNKSVLEIGVGNGKTLKSILKQNPKSITAIDFSEEAINLAKKLIKPEIVTFVNSNIINFQSEEKFDIIICYYIFNNLTERGREIAVNNFSKLLKKDGIILFEDFAVGDFRQKGEEIEKNTIQRKDGLICHFFSEGEVKFLFNNFNDTKISIKTSNPIRNNKKIERRIISAIIKN